MDLLPKTVHHWRPHPLPPRRLWGDPVLFPEQFSRRDLNWISSVLKEASLFPQDAWPRKQAGVGAGGKGRGRKEGKIILVYFTQSWKTNKLPTGFMQMYLLHVKNPWWGEKNYKWEWGRGWGAGELSHLQDWSGCWSLDRVTQPSTPKLGQPS